MLTRLLALSLSGALLIAGCDRGQPGFQEPLVVEANYRLLFNDALVGNALFVFEITGDGGYRIDAFTTPAGEMLREGADEVLETSRGSIDGDAIRPVSFEQSVMSEGGLQLASLTFDWDSQRLQFKGPQGEQTIGLSPDNHDRLSYLLTAHRLAATGEGASQIHVASLIANEVTRLEVEGKGHVEVPLGNFDAIAIRRISPDDEGRRLWFDPDTLPLPLRVLQLRDGNSVDMQLEGFGRH